MSAKEYLQPQNSFSINSLFALSEDDFTDRTITSEHRDTNGAIVIARKGDRVKNKLTQQELARRASVPGRVINLIETNRGYPTEDVAKSIASALRVKKDVLFTPGSEAHTRSRRQPAKLRLLLTGDEAYKRTMLNAAFLRGNYDDEEFIEGLQIEAKSRREYFAQIYKNYGLILTYDLMLVMNTPEELVDQAREISKAGKKSWAMDRLTVAENRIVFMHDKPRRIKLGETARNLSILSDDPEVDRLRLVYTLEEEVKNLPSIKPQRGTQRFLKDQIAIL